MDNIDDIDNINDNQNYPEWNYDGSSTGQAIGSDSEVIIRPVAVFKCPFRKGNNMIVLCDTYLPNGNPHNTNHRKNAYDIFDKNIVTEEMEVTKEHEDKRLIQNTNKLSADKVYYSGKDIKGNKFKDHQLPKKSI